MHLLGKSRTLGAAGVVATAALIAGCGSSHTTTHAASARIGSSAISQAADVSGAARGEKVSYTLTEQLPSVGKLTLTGTGAFNASPQQGEMNVTLAIPGLSSLGSEAASLANLPLTLVIKNKVFYVKLPSALASRFGSYTGGKSWVSVNLGQLASTSGVPGLSGLLNGQTSPTDPAATLKELEDASSNGITKVGTATVDGVATTEYSATLDLSKLSSALPASAAKVFKRALARSSRQLGMTSIPYDVYIDSDHLIRRLSMSFSAQAKGNTVPVSLQMDFLSYGQQPAPTVPAAGDVFDLTNLLSTLGSHMSGAGTSGLSG